VAKVVERMHEGLISIPKTSKKKKNFFLEHLNIDYKFD
jgi:hypothetical protein